MSAQYHGRQWLVGTSMGHTAFFAQFPFTGSALLRLVCLAVLLADLLATAGLR